MVKGGYALALDDFLYNPGMSSLIGLCRIIKFDLRATPLHELGGILRKIGGRWDVKFLAEKVETHQEFETARDMGFEYFQGYFFSKPEVLEGKDMAGANLNLLEIMAKANQEDFDFKELERIILRDALISYKLLRYINSAYFRPIQEITSIRHAIALMGERGIRRFMSLIAMASLAADKPNELIKESIVRARFCESLGGLHGSPANGAELFTLGLFSLIDAIMDQDMTSLMERIPLCEGIKEALINRKGALARYLSLVEAYLQGLWHSVSTEAAKMGLDEGLLPRCFMDSVGWAEDLEAL
jgi:EAL and modified HD-GYP domain-containing signal transduction protein